MSTLRWLWKVLLCGLRRYEGACLRAGLSLASVHFVGLVCVKMEVRRSSQYPGDIRRSVENTLNKYKYDANKSGKMIEAVNSAHRNINWRSIEAKQGYKNI